MKENERKKRVRWKKSLKERHDWQEKIGDGEKKTKKRRNERNVRNREGRVEKMDRKEEGEGERGLGGEGGGEENTCMEIN